MLEHRLFTAFEGPFITGILGPRRVGKSTLIEHFIETHIGATALVMLNMDKMEQREQVKAGRLKQLILTTLKKPLERGKRAWVTIDEAQKCPELFEQIKVIYDEYKDQDAIKFIITGSALLELHRLSAETLAGRIQLFHMSAFGLAEALELTRGLKIEHSLFELLETQDERLWQDYMDSLLPLSVSLQETVRELLLWGGLPEVLQVDNENTRKDYLENYLQTYLEKDVLPISSVTDLRLYRQLMNIIGEQTGSIRDDKRLLQALGCHRDTLNKYRGYLQATLMYCDLYPYINTTLKRIVKSPKGYLMNNGLVGFLQGIFDEDILLKTGQIGHRVENWFLNELTIWLNRISGRHEIYYWRNSTGMEVDFIVKKPPYIYPFEITMTSYIEPKKIRSLMSFREYEPEAQYLFYVYNGEFKIDTLKKIVFIPLWAIC